MQRWELKLLQGLVGVGSLVPIVAGAVGVVQGAVPGDVDLDSHFRYLSGLLLGIGVAYAASIPNIERHEQRIWLLTGLVALGGLCRLLAALSLQSFTSGIAAALAMELAVAPLIGLWTRRCARSLRARA